MGHEEIKIPSCDLIIHSGDATYMGEMREIITFNSWVKSLGVPFIFVAGNHDWLFQTDRRLAEQLLNAAIYLEDSSVTIKGIKIYGSPWQPEFNNWAFNLPRGNLIKAKWDMIPNDTDILITHGPPIGILDMLHSHLGCHDLSERLKQMKPKNPKIHCFGHIHNGYGKQKIGKRWYVNASVMNEQYNIVNKPIILNI